MPLKDRLYDQAINALAMGAGGADELSFGLSNKYLPGAKQLTEENPWASNAGRVASYAIPLPLPNKLKAAVRAPEAAAAILKRFPQAAGLLDRIGKRGLSTVQNLLMEGSGKLAEKATSKLGTGYGATAAKGAIEGVLSGEGQHLIRKSLGTADDVGSASGTEDRLVAETLFGGGGGALGKLIKGVAPKVYNHPGILNKFKKEESEKLSKELLDEGVRGSLGGAFKDRAKKFKSDAKVTFDELHGKIVPREQQEAKAAARIISELGGVPVPAPKGTVDPRAMGSSYKKDFNEWAGTGVGEGELNALGKGYNRAVKSLNPDQYGATNLGEVQTKLKQTNTRLTKLNARDRAKMQGAQGLGENTADTDRAKSLRDAYEELYKKGIDDFGDGDMDTLAYNKAKRTHRKGADLEENMRTHEIVTSHSQPGFLAPDWFRNIARVSIGSMPIRSNLGVAMDRLGPKVGAVGGRVAELRSRGNAAPPAADTAPALPPGQTAEEGNDFDQFVPGDNEVAPEAKAASAKQLGVAPEELAMVADPNNPEKRSAVNALWQRRQAYKDKNKNPKAEEPDDEEENPFLQFVPE